MQGLFSLLFTRFARASYVVFCLLAVPVGGHAFDALRLNEKSKLFNVFDQSVSIVGAKYVGWGKDWDWAGVAVRPDKLAKDAMPGSYRYVGDIAKFGVSFINTVKTEDDKITWRYQWQKKTDIAEIRGIGIEFDLNLKSPTFTGAQPDPELLPNKEGWRWQLADGQKIEVKFSPALANIFFERKQKNRIRAMFYKELKVGNEETTMTVSVSGTRAKVLGPVRLEYEAPGKRENWPVDVLDNAVSPVDLSGLNDKPAGKHGYVQAKGADLAFSDGAPARFWGANLMAYALFQTADPDIKTHAKRLAQLGFNLVRIHHHDSKWVTPNIFQDGKEGTLRLSEKSFQKLDLWISALKEQGIYIWLDLHVGRHFTEADGIEAFGEIAKDKPRAEVKGFNYYNESIQKKMQDFNEAYLKHVNPYTHLAYKDDPAIMALLITNENDLTQHFGGLMLPEKKVPEHTALFIKDVKRFSGQSGLPEKSLLDVWNPGNSKLYLNDAEHQFNQKMLGHLRGIGTKSMVATTNSWGAMGLFSLPSLTDGDLIDVHSYGGGEDLNRNPRFNAGFLAWIGAAQVTGKPLAVTEWNMEPFPVLDRFISPLHLAGTASLQGWDAPMVYGYSQNRLTGNNNKLGNYSIYSDPGMVGVMPAAALLYRQGQVSLAKKNYEIKLSAENFYRKKLNPKTVKTIRTLLETSRFSVTVPEHNSLPWLKNNLTKGEQGAIVLDDIDKDMIPPGQDYVESDNSELKRDWKTGVYTVNTPFAQVAAGWLGGHPVKLSHATFNIQTKKALVAVQSLDKKALPESKRLFITVVARSKPTPDQLHCLSEPVNGSITVDAQARMTLYPINRLGQREKPVKTQFNKGKYEIKLEQDHPAYWYELSSE